MVQDGRWLVLDGKEWVLDDKRLVLDGKQGLAHCILGGRSAVRLHTRLWPGNHRRLLCRSRSGGIDMMVLLVLMRRMVTMFKIVNHSVLYIIKSHMQSMVFNDFRDSFLNI